MPYPALIVTGKDIPNDLHKLVFRAIRKCGLVPVVLHENKALMYQVLEWLVRLNEKKRQLWGVLMIGEKFWYTGNLGSHEPNNPGILDACATAKHLKKLCAGSKLIFCSSCADKEIETTLFELLLTEQDLRSPSELTAKITQLMHCSTPSANKAVMS